MLQCAGMPEREAPARTFVTHSQEQTIALGRRIGERLRRGDVVLLYGPFGAGKTHLAKGLAAAFGVGEAEVNSPSFVLINEYEADRAHGRMAIFHIDLYRLEQPEELRSVGLEDALGGDVLAIVEWAERAPDRFPDQHLAVFIELGGEHERRFRIEPRGERYSRVWEGPGVADQGSGAETLRPGP